MSNVIPEGKRYQYKDTRAECYGWQVKLRTGYPWCDSNSKQAHTLRTSPHCHLMSSLRGLQRARAQLQHQLLAVSELHHRTFVPKFLRHPTHHPPRSQRDEAGSGWGRRCVSHGAHSRGCQADGDGPQGPAAAGTRAMQATLLSAGVRTALPQHRTDVADSQHGQQWPMTLRCARACHTGARGQEEEWQWQGG